MAELLELQLDRRLAAVDPARRVADRRLQGQLGDGWTWLDAQPLVAAIGRVTLRAEPDSASPQVTEALLGEDVELLEERPGGWAWVRTAHDGYLGYAQRNALTQPADQPTVMVTALRGHLFARPDITAEVLDTVSYGARLSFLDPQPLELKGREWWRAAYRGQDAYVSAAVVAPIPGGLFKNLTWIQRFMDTPYLWGGRSAWGIDCSGLAGLFHGFALPRDADQQRAACQPVERPQPGDLAFFPGHVGIMLDSARLLHANASQMRVSIDVLGEGEAGQRLAADLTGFGRFEKAGRMTLHSETLELTTRQPFGIARWTHSVYPRTFVTFQHSEYAGRGEAAPNAYYGETRATVEAVLPELAPCLTDPWDWDGLAERMAARFPHGHPSVRCALEMAALESCALEVGQPVWRLLGLSDTPSPESSYTISLAELDKMRAQVNDAWAAGYRILKVKLGTDRDVAILEALRAEAPDARLRVDANAAWSRSQAKRMLGVLDALDVELLEQPLVAEDLEGHAELRRVSRLPLVADESLHDLSVLPRLAGAFDAVNLKLAKLGGPVQALKAARLARALGMNVMLGCMIESSLGIAAAVHLAGLTDWVDLDGALLLSNDPYQGLVWQAGQVQKPSVPGWGVHSV